jgi:hypothetical protein
MPGIAPPIIALTTPNMSTVRVLPIARLTIIVAV